MEKLGKLRFCFLDLINLKLQVKVNGCQGAVGEVALVSENLMMLLVSGVIVSNFCVLISQMKYGSGWIRCQFELPPQIL